MPKSLGRARPSRRSRLNNGEATNSPGVLSNSSTSSRRLGKRIVHKAGSQTTAIGSSEVDTHGYRIPDDRYRGYFGPDHGFRIYGLPFLVVGGYPRFQYEGYWFSAVDPWPEYWANDWYDTYDVYVTYVDNGYYLFNRRYPNVGIAVSISM